MKKILTLILAVSIFVTGCDKEVEFEQQLKKLEPANIDATAGTWKPMFLASYSTLTVPAPAATTSDAYKAELASIKAIQADLTDEQKRVIEYWSAGGILRWNEILRGLVAKYNLPPAPNNLGTYPAPDANNPFADVAFPFANPPYAARAYSYVTIAQYDAMKAAWYWKYQPTHNRATPYTIDSGIEALMPKTALPAYPSEEAVMSGVTAELLKLLFPAALQEITLKAAEQRNAALWSGKAAASDITAGLNLGVEVANLFITRARGDGMGAAGGNATQWAALKKNAEDRGEVAWVSLETPPRPPMLPLFGLRTLGAVNTGVRSWMMTNAEIIAERPLAPPPTGSDEMTKEVEEVKYYTKNATRERYHIVHKWADGAGTYTPAGHWNEIASHFIEEANLSEVKAARAFAYLNAVEHDAAVGCWETKFFYFNPRPAQLDPGIKTLTGVPNFPAYTSGHSTFSGGAAAVLGYLFPDKANFVDAEAQEASLSRLYGGIHYRKDCEAGLDHGRRIAAYSINFAKTDGGQ